ncbi:MAG: gas vesicle protein [Chloroflexi bacterium]|nr:gas vesicle protein [Chloroflexota bacterium]
MAIAPTAVAQCGVSDLLERILDKGMVIHADLLISVAGIPLVGISLKAALAGMETMLKYGMLVDWDDRTRQWARKEQEKRRHWAPVLAEGEQVLATMPGSHWHSEGICRSWRPGHLYVTDRRIVLWRSQPAEILLEAPYSLISAVHMRRGPSVAKSETDYLHISFRDGGTALLHATEVPKVREAIEKQMLALGLEPERHDTAGPAFGESATFLRPGEGITHSGRMWHLALPASQTVSGRDEWQPGRLCLTNQRLCWLHDPDDPVVWESPIDSLIHVTTQPGNISGMPKANESVNILYKTASGNKVACFCGKPLEVKDWEMAISDAIRHGRDPLSDGWESCPGCEQRAPGHKLLTEGCSLCGWMSPRLRRLTQG